MAKTLVGQMIEAWLHERKSRSLLVLAQETGISEGNLIRLKNGPQVPELDTLCVLGVKTGQQKLADEAMKQHYPESLEYFRKFWQSYAPPKQDGLDPSEFFETPDGTRIFITLFTRAGLSREKIRASFGDAGVRVVDRLVAKGFAISKDDDVVLPCDDWFTYRGPADVTRVIRHLSYLFDLEESGKDSPFTRIGVITESINEEAAKRARAIIQDASLELKKLFDDPASAGDNIVSVSMMMQPIK